MLATSAATPALRKTCHVADALPDLHVLPCNPQLGTVVCQHYICSDGVAW